MGKNISVARVFEDIGGYFVCDDSLEYLDCRGSARRSKASALRLAFYYGYTHAVGSGTYWKGIKKIPNKFME